MAAASNSQFHKIASRSRLLRNFSRGFYLRQDHTAGVEWRQALLEGERWNDGTWGSGASCEGTLQKHCEFFGSPLEARRSRGGNRSCYICCGRALQLFSIDSCY